jgi:hypothetical protein
MVKNKLDMNFSKMEISIKVNILTKCSMEKECIHGLTGRNMMVSLFRTKGMDSENGTHSQIKMEIKLFT